MVKATLKGPIKCPLKLDCYASCVWFKGSKCIFPKAVKQVKRLEWRSKMDRSRNPYPEFLIDEASGIEVPDIRHEIWAEGYKTGKADSEHT